MKGPHLKFPLFLGLLSLTLGSGLPGCTWLEPKPRELSGSGMDMFAPLNLRIHPLTRLQAEPAGSQPTGEGGSGGSETQNATNNATVSASTRLEPIEIYVELKDQFGDVGKGVGTLDLRVETPRLGLLGGDTIAEWSVDLQTPLANSKYWDAITRTYVFRYRPTPHDGNSVMQPGKQYTVRVRMDFPNHTTLQDHQTFTAK